MSLSWQYILFGLGALTYARHPEGLLEYGKRTSLNLIQQLARSVSQAPGTQASGGRRARRPWGGGLVRGGRLTRAACPGPRRVESEVTADEPLLVAEHVTKTFAGITALDDVSLTWGSGSSSG